MFHGHLPRRHQTKAGPAVSFGADELREKSVPGRRIHARPVVLDLEDGLSALLKHSGHNVVCLLLILVGITGLDCIGDQIGDQAVNLLGLSQNLDALVGLQLELEC